MRLVLLVYGTAVRRDGILSLAAHRARNLHTGMSPYYRGVDCAFWPLYYGELERRGQIDGGNRMTTGRESNATCLTASPA